MNRNCVDCKWCESLRLKSGAWVNVCKNDEGGVWPEEVGYLGCDCDDFESDYDECEDDEHDR